jgi:hypothetical protein
MSLLRAGGRPLFRDPDGNPVNTGWTGYDCGTPICVQAEAFYFNIIFDETTLKSNQLNLLPPELNMPLGLVGPDQAIPGVLLFLQLIAFICLIINIIHFYAYLVLVLMKMNAY